MRNSTLDIEIDDRLPILYTVNQGILVTDARGAIVFFNRSQALKDGACRASGQ